MNNILIWWLTQADYEKYSSLKRPHGIPQEIWQEVLSRAGRGGRFRLWVPSTIKYKNMPELPQEKWDAFMATVNGDAGGIVITTENFVACKAWGGIVTDESLNIL